MEYGIVSIIGAHAQIEMEEGKLRIDKNGFAKRKRTTVFSGLKKKLKKNKERV